tara:strand:- start:320 stop:709 length:390 start_codon:yes stop_codon:yes gene_type:complete
MPLKPPVPFYMLDDDSGWEPVPGGAPGVEQKMLSGSLAEESKIGVRTRLIRFQPSTIAPNVFIHDYWEEVYLISGKLVNGCDAQGAGGSEFTAPAYACRPPGTEHGPFTSTEGCTFFEIQYYVGGADGS